MSIVDAMRRAMATIYREGSRSEVPRAQVTLWTADGVRLNSYTCPMVYALQRALADVAADGGTGYATIACLDGSFWCRIPERDGMAEKPTAGLKLL